MKTRQRDMLMRYGKACALKAYQRILLCGNNTNLYICGIGKRINKAILFSCEFGNRTKKMSE